MLKFNVQNLPAHNDLDSVGPNDHHEKYTPNDHALTDHSNLPGVPKPNVTGGYAPIGTNGKIDISYLDITGSGLAFAGNWDPTSGAYPNAPVDQTYYNVTTAATFDGKDWNPGDWAVYVNATVGWQKIDNTERVTAVNNKTGAVQLTLDDIPDGTTRILNTTEINDTVIATDSTWSSSKISTEISSAVGATINDTVTAIDSTWSSSKISTEISSVTTTAITDANAYTDTKVASIDFPVDSVNGKTNVVQLTLDDIPDGTTRVLSTTEINDTVTAIDSTWSSSKISTEISSAASTAITDANAYTDTKVANIDFPVDSVNGKIGNVILNLSDINDVSVANVQIGQILSWDGSQWVAVDNIATQNVGNTGIFGGGYDGLNNLSIIDYISINIPSNAQNFGYLQIGKIGISATSNGINDRGIFGGGYDPNTLVDIIEYVNISYAGNGQTFGRLTSARVNLKSSSNSSNNTGLFISGNNNGQINIIDYININVLSDAHNFGGLVTPRDSHSATSDGVNNRVIFGGGYINGVNRTTSIEFVDVTSLTNSSNFGQLQLQRVKLAATSNGTSERGIFGGGYDGNNRLWIISYVMITTPGNALTFSYLTKGRDSLSSTSNGSNNTGVFAGGGDGTSYYNIIDYLTISNNNNSQDFGDLITPRNWLSSTSNA